MVTFLYNAFFRISRYTSVEKKSQFYVALVLNYLLKIFIYLSYNGVPKPNGITNTYFTQ